MRPKGKLFALFAVFAAIGLVTASGAFTTVQADRTADVDVAGDANALLQLTPGDTEDANDYAQDNNGQVEILLDGSGDNDGDGDAQGSGVNVDARTTVEGVINITNQGSQPVWVYVETDESGSSTVSFHNGTSPAYDTDSNITTSTNAKQIDPGTGFDVSMEIDTRNSITDNSSSTTVMDTVTIYANASDPT
jgi:hypothetical protein